MGPLRLSPWPLQVFAVDDSSVQLTWPASPAEDLEVQVGGVVARPGASPSVEVVLDAGGARADGARPCGEGPIRRWAHRYWDGRRPLDRGWPAGPGSVVIEGLAPGTTYDVVASAAGVPAFLAAQARTLTPPPGALLYKFATISDLHIGEKNFGVLRRIHEAEEGPLGFRGTGTNIEAFEPLEPYPVRALRAAIDEAAAWGAQLLVAKGDLSDWTTPAEVRDVGTILAASPVPVEAVLGNHDNQFGVDARALLEAQGVVVPWQPRAVDLPGLRLVLVNTASGNPHLHRGELPAQASQRIAALTVDAPAAWVGLHHPPERHRFPTVYPPGLPFEEGVQLMEALVGANRATFVSCGHRHRNRRYSYGPIPITEVGSTKDYPGVWAGYKVYESGLVQMVRRTSRKDVMAWTEATRRAMNGQWKRWSPGRLEERC
ncbi:MAG TPA: metallophosphoesterase, partial [Acidimicrobiales bacterium]|nr:metallophosphoesterase [Acidimicrobiales bacterium]